MMTESWRHDLIEAFERFDADDNGVIDQNELDALLTALGSTMSASDRKLGFKMIDEDQDGLITLEELASWWEIVRKEGA